jgi:hypothetical protein
VEDPLFLLSIPIGVVITLEALRTRIVVDHRAGVVLIRRAFREYTIAIDDIIGVRAPAWFPMCLTLREGARKPTGVGLGGRREIMTNIHTGDLRPDILAAHIAEAIGVPITSVGPSSRSDGSEFEQG